MCVKDKDTKMNIPHILLTNDDGVDAMGIRILAELLSNFADVLVMAPTERVREQLVVLHLIRLYVIKKRVNTAESKYMLVVEHLWIV